MPASEPPADVREPVVVTVTFWMDREPDIEFEPLPPWLAAAVLTRASELMYDMAEADWEEPDEGEDEE